MAAIWAMGITQHTTGVLNVLSLANLQMLLGNMGVPGGGVNPLRGQNNVQGACDMGALPNVFPGYQAVTDAAVVATFEDAWALGEEGDGAGNGDASLGLSTHAGLTLTEIIEAAGSGQVRGLFVLGENPVLTDPDSNHVRRCLERTELLVLQEIFPSETSHYADVLLPGVSFAERDGTFTNTERRVQRFRQAVPPVGAARADWRIIAELARRALDTQRRHPQGPRAAWDHRAPAEIMCEIAALTPSYSGVAYERLDRGERLQWPVWGRDHAGTPILHVGRFVRGKGRFHAVDHLPPQELPDHDYPLLLTTGRVLYHWHGGEMTRRVQGLVDVFGESLLEIAPEDACRFGVEDLQPVVVSSRRGRMLARAVVTGRVSAGVVFGDFHFPGERNVNNLTIGALDPVAKIPEYKVCAVRVEAAPEENSRSTADPVSDAGQAPPAIGR
jgi:formate dehydrogenase major subunit/formate dehydrogenase alpha subunit